MKTYKYKVTIEGDVHFPKCFLEHLTKVPMVSVAPQKFEGELTLAVNGNLDYDIEVTAITGTAWSATIKNVDVNKKVLELSDKKTGAKIPNFSKENGQVNPD